MSKAKLKLGPEMVVDITDNGGVSPVFADLIVEARNANGVIAISLAALVIEGDKIESKSANIVSRLRMTPDAATFLHNILGGLLGLTGEAPPKEQIN